MLNTDDLRYHTEIGTGYSKQMMLDKAANEIDDLRKKHSALEDEFIRQREVCGAMVTDRDCKIRGLEAQMLTLVEDANRYRFVRAADRLAISAEAARDPVAYDAAIDEAMAPNAELRGDGPASPARRPA